jgi:hypothetical protein
LQNNITVIILYIDFILLFYKDLNVWNFIQVVHEQIFSPFKCEYTLYSILTVLNCKAKMKRLLKFLLLVFILTSLMYATWLISKVLLPGGLLRPYFSRLFETRVGELSFMKIILANLFPFLGLQFMNLYKGQRWPGGLYVLPIFWIIYGVLLGTNSFVYSGQPVPFSVSILWTRMGFTELLAYTAGYEATSEWAIWEGFLRAQRIVGKKWKPQIQDWIYWGVGLLLLVIAVLREVD